MANGRCRMHGGKSPGALSGEGHWNYKRGGRTQTEEQALSRGLRKARARRQDGRALAELLALLKEARRRRRLPGDLPDRIRRLVDEFE